MAQGQHFVYTSTMKTKIHVRKTFDLNAVKNALDTMSRACGGGDIPSKMIAATAREIKLSTREFAEAAASLNRPFANNHVR